MNTSQSLLIFKNMEIPDLSSLRTEFRKHYTPGRDIMFAVIRSGT